MTSTPPSSSDGSALPPRHRPNLGNLAKDTTETDLWSFEDDLDLPTEALQEFEPEFADNPKPAGKILPRPRERQGTVPPREMESRQIPKTPSGGEDRIRMNVNKLPPKGRPAGGTTGVSQPESEFDELDDWDDSPVQPEIGNPLAGAGTETEYAKSASITQPAEAGRIVEQSKPSTAVPSGEVARVEDEFAPAPSGNARPVSLRPHLGLTKIERIGLIALFVILVAGAGSILIFSLKGLPTASIREKEIDFPIKGSHLTVKSAVSYWRAPVTSGPTPETVRPATLLLPEIELEVSGGPAALRVLFRNDERSYVGDSVIRTIQGGGTVRIAATAGFEDLGMHSAYRTGATQPWTIEVFEAPSKDTAGKDFKKLFETNISTDRR